MHLGFMKKLTAAMAFNAILIACAAVTTGLVIRHEIFASSTASLSQKSRQPTYIASWKSLLGAAHRIGVANAPVKILVFSDLECPFCALFEKNYEIVSRRHPQQTALYFIHSPLPMHRFAIPAAKAAECAGEQGRFNEMQTRLFAEQDQLGLKSWNDFATAARVPDLPAFTECISNAAIPKTVRAGIALSRQLSVTETPTVIINGWKVDPPNAEKLEDEVQSQLRRGKPVD